MNAKSSLVALICMAMSLLVPSTLNAAPLTKGNLLFTERGPVGPSKLYEYTPTGHFLQEFTIPAPPPDTDFGAVSDVVVDDEGIVHVSIVSSQVVGFSRRRYIASLDPRANTWSYLSAPNFFGPATFAYEGSLDYQNGFLYAQSGHTAYRFSLDDSSAIPIPSGTAISIGANGLLYAFLNDIYGNGRQVRVYDASSFDLLNTISLETGDPRNPGLTVTALTVNAEGLMTLAVAGQGVFQVDAQGNRLAHYQTSLFPWDIDEFAPNKFAMTSRFGQVLIFNDGLNPNAVTTFTLPRAADGFVGVVTVPESSAFFLICIVLIPCLYTVVLAWVRKRAGFNASLRSVPHHMRFSSSDAVFPPEDLSGALGTEYR